MPKFESLESWIGLVWKDQAALAEKMGVARNTVSQWMTGKSRIKPPVREKLKDLGYDGPWPEVGGDLTREDLKAVEDKLDDLLKKNEAILEVLRAMAGK